MPSKIAAFKSTASLVWQRRRFGCSAACL